VCGDERFDSALHHAGIEPEQDRYRAPARSRRVRQGCVRRRGSVAADRVG
jgi:hypothetical protein